MAISIGGNSPTQGFTDRAKAASALLGDRIMLWLPSANNSNAIAGVNIVRLPNWNANEAVSDYLLRVVGTINEWAHVPNVVYQLGNEPDLEAGHNGERIQEFADAIHAVASGVKVGNPPLSVEHAALMRADHCDVVLVHSYWERSHPEDIANPGLGASYRTALALAGTRSVYVTEVNAVQTGSGVDWADRNAQVARWLDQAERDGVAGACLFILDAAPDWATFDVGPEAVSDILARRTPAPVPVPTPPPPPPPPLPPLPPVTGLYTRSYDPRGYRPLDPRWLPYLRRFNADEATQICATYEMAARQIGYDANAMIAQGMVETERFTSQRWRNAHAAAGIGIFADSTRDIIWGAPPHGDVLTGIEAQADLLTCYFGNDEEPFGTLRPHGFGGMRLGFGHLSDMDGIWAADTGYSAAIVGYLNDVLGGVVPAPSPQTGPTLADVARVANGFIGRGTTEEGQPEFLWCEQVREEIEQDAGLPRVRWPTAAARGAAYVAAGKMQTTMPPPKGSGVIWSLDFEPRGGHIASADDYPYIITTYKTGMIERIDAVANGWYSAPGFLGWYIPDGVADDRNVVPTYRKLRVPMMGDGFNDAEILRIWFGTSKPTATQKKNFPYNPQFGIEQAYGRLLNGTFNEGDQDYRSLSISPGACISGEEFDSGTPGRSVRYFANGKITALRQPDGTYLFRYN